MKPEYYLKLLQRSWYILIACLLLGLAAGYLTALAQPKQYTANASGFITTPSQNSESLPLAVAGDNYAKSRAKSYADVGTSRVVAEEVIKELGLDTSPESLVRGISVVVPPDTVTVQVTAKAETAEQAREIANAWIRAMGNQIKNLESSKATQSIMGPAATLEPLESAVLPSAPSSPIIPLYLSLGGFLGLVLGVVIAFLKGRNDKRIRSVKDVESVSDYALIGKLPVESSLVKSESRLLDKNASLKDARVRTQTQILNEGLRDLRTNLEFIDVDNPPRSIVVTSALPGDGKSTVSANLATIIAQSGRQVVLIDADLRRPTVAKSFNIDNNLGLTDLLAGRTNLDSVIHQYDKEIPMYVIPAGTLPPNPAEILASQAMKDLIDGFTSEGITVLMDAPPIIPVTDASILTAKFDGAIVVASAGVTRTDSLGQAIGKIESVKGKIFGLVLNRIPLKGIDKKSYGYYNSSYAYIEEK